MEIRREKNWARGTVGSDQYTGHENVLACTRRMHTEKRVEVDLGTPTTRGQETEKWLLDI